jgi:hypothetical protein
MIVPLRDSAPDVCSTWHLNTRLLQGVCVGVGWGVEEESDRTTQKPVDTTTTRWSDVFDDSAVHVTVGQPSCTVHHHHPSAHPPTHQCTDLRTGDQSSKPVMNAGGLPPAIPSVPTQPIFYPYPVVSPLQTTRISDFQLCWETALQTSGTKPPCTPPLHTLSTLHTLHTHGAARARPASTDSQPNRTLRRSIHQSPSILLCTDV